MGRILFVTCIFFLFNSCFSQTSKEGYRKIFLDSVFAICDSADAFYFGYGYFDGKREITDFNSMHADLYYGEPWKYDGYNSGAEGYLFVLNGTLKTQKYGRYTIYSFENGYVKKIIEYRLSGIDTVSFSSIFYDSLYCGQPGSAYFESVSAKDTVTGYYRNGNYGWNFYAETDSRGLEYSNGKYPYWKGKIPPFIGVVAGLEGFKNNGYEIGLAFSGELEGDDVYGGMSGFILTYKNRFDRSYYSLNAEYGVYSYVSFAIGYGYHSNGINHTNTFKLVTGITLFHLQMLYSYNFYKNSKNEIPELFHHTFTLRYALPVLRIG